MGSEMCIRDSPLRSPSPPLSFLPSPHAIEARRAAAPGVENGDPQLPPLVCHPSPLEASSAASTRAPRLEPGGAPSRSPLRLTY